MPKFIFIFGSKDSLSSLKNSMPSDLLSSLTPYHRITLCIERTLAYIDKILFDNYSLSTFCFYSFFQNIQKHSACQTKMLVNTNLIFSNIVIILFFALLHSNTFHVFFLLTKVKYLVDNMG